MNFNVISVMPDLISQTLEFGVVGSAFKKDLCSLRLVNPRDFTQDTHQSVDDRPFGGGDGMLMMAEPLQQALESLDERGPVVFLSPQGQPFDDVKARQWSREPNLTLICGRYGGVDQRFLSHNNIQEISIGDYVLSGGELAASVIIDAVVRHRPSVLGHGASAADDSFKDQLLECPHFTRPREWQGRAVPSVLLSGDHKKINEFQHYIGIAVTLLKRPDLVEQRSDLAWDQCLNYFQGMDVDDFNLLEIDKQGLLDKVKEKLRG